MHPLCFHRSGQKHPALESSSICAHTGHSPNVAQLPRGFPWCIRKRWGATRWVNHSFFLILLHSEFAFSSFPSRSALLSRLQLSPPVQPSDGKAKALCTRELHPSLLQGGLDHGTTLRFLYCCVVIWTDPKLTASHWHPPHPGLPCASQAWGFLQVPDLESLKVTHLHIKEVHPWNLSISHYFKI